MNYMRVNYVMTRHSGFTFSELENMEPWEKEIYVSMFDEELKEKGRQEEQT